MLHEVPGSAGHVQHQHSAMWGCGRGCACDWSAAQLIPALCTLSLWQRLAGNMQRRGAVGQAVSLKRPLGSLLLAAGGRGCAPAAAGNGRSSIPF